MDKLLNYVCDELEELEHKADKGKLSAAEIQYGDTLAHLKKNLLTADAMMDEGYSEYYPYDGRNRNGRNSYARGRGRNAKRDSMGRYSRNYSMDDGMIEELRELMEDAPDEQTKREFKRFISKIEKM